jgi:hypothetical protein
MCVQLRNNCLACFAIVLLISLAACSSSEKSPGVTSGIHEGDRLTSFSQEITSPTSELNMKVGETHTLDITVKNTGSQAWFTGAGPNFVDAGYRWMDAKGNALAVDMETKRSSLSSSVVQPGAGESLKLQVVAPPTPGSYQMWVSMVQEGVAWFYGVGAKPLVVKVNVD